jgi:hypothetical protein
MYAVSRRTSGLEDDESYLIAGVASLHVLLFCDLIVDLGQYCKSDRGLHKPTCVAHNES